MSPDFALLLRCPVTSQPLHLEQIMVGSATRQELV